MKPDRIDRPEARRLAEEEFRRFAELAAVLTPDEWTLPTDCSAWDVRKIALQCSDRLTRRPRCGSSRTSCAGGCR